MPCETRRLLLRTIAAAAITLSASGVSAATLLERVKSGETISVGTANEAPFSFIAPDGKLGGSDIVLLDAVLKAMGSAKTEGVRTEFGALIPGLKAGRFDIIAAGLYISPERCRQVAFAEPVFAIGNTIIVPAGNPRKLHSFGDLVADPNLRIGHSIGSRLRGEAIALGVKESQLVPLPDGPSLVAAIKAGRLDAALYPALSAQTLLDAAKDPSIERAVPFETPIVDGKPRLSYGSFAFRPDDADFAKAFNEKLTEIVKSPAYAEMVRPFGFTKADLPTSVTTAELCGK